MEDNQKQLFDRIKSKHPEWTDEQIWVATSIDHETDKVIDDAGPQSVDIDDPDIISIIVRKAQNWLAEILPAIYEKVAAFFDNLLENLKDIIVQGIKDVFNFLSQMIFENF